MDMIIFLLEKIIMVIGCGAFALLGFGIIINIAASVAVSRRKDEQAIYYSQPSGQAVVASPLSYEHNLKLVA